MRRWVAPAITVGCVEQGPLGPAGVRFEGSVEITVHELGPFEGRAQVLREDGTPIDPSGMTAGPPEVLRIDGQQVVAVGPGDGRIVVIWHDLAFEQGVRVRPDVRLSLDNPPMAMLAGGREPIVARVWVGDVPSGDVPLVWTCGPPPVCRAEQGWVEGVGPGLGWLGVHAPDGTSVVHEFEVLAP